MAMTFFLAITFAYRSPSTRLFFLYPLICSFVIASGYMVWGYHEVYASRSSTAAIGFLFVPVFSAALAVVGFVVSWACFYVVHFVIQRIKRTPVRLASVLLLVLAVVLFTWTGYVGYNKIARHRLLNEAASGGDVDRLETVLADGVSSRDWEVLSKVAKNRNTPKNNLVRIFDYCKPSIAEFNPPEYSILFSLAQNPRTPSDILAALAACRQSSIRYVVAVNPSTPMPALRKLAEDQDNSVRTYAKPRLLARERDGKSEKE